jgi:hypothetical protein
MTAKFFVDKSVLVYAASKVLAEFYWSLRLGHWKFCRLAPDLCPLTSPDAFSAGQRLAVQLDDNRHSTRFEPGRIGRRSTAAGFLGILRRIRGNDGAVEEGDNVP